MKIKKTLIIICVVLLLAIMIPVHLLSSRVTGYKEHDPSYDKIKVAFSHSWYLQRKIPELTDERFCKCVEDFLTAPGALYYQGGVYSGALKAPIRRTGNHQSGRWESSADMIFRCYGTAVPVVGTTIPERGNRNLFTHSTPDPTHTPLSSSGSWMDLWARC